MVVVALLSVDLVESVDLVSVVLVVNCIVSLYGYLLGKGYGKFKHHFDMLLEAVIN